MCENSSEQQDLKHSAQKIVRSSSGDQYVTMHCYSWMRCKGSVLYLLIFPPLSCPRHVLGSCYAHFGLYGLQWVRNMLLGMLCLVSVKYGRSRAKHVPEYEERCLNITRWKKLGAKGRPGEKIQILVLDTFKTLDPIFY
jgi:hypothetical protein